MSNENGPEGEDGEEPSMEDILASIRSILSEDEEKAVADVAPKPGPELAPEPIHMQEPILEPEPVLATPEPEPVPTPVIDTPGTEPTREPVITENPPLPTPTPPVEDLIELTPEMIVTAENVVSGMTSEASSDVLAELARAIIDRRDMNISSGSDVTLEGMVREMLRPILREWLDRNLPYLIERLVKNEIDRMINRAQGLPH